jgi:hypothetical protein
MAAKRTMSRNWKLFSIALTGKVERPQKIDDRAGCISEIGASRRKGKRAGRARLCP